MTTLYTCEYFIFNQNNNNFSDNIKKIENFMIQNEMKSFVLSDKADKIILFVFDENQRPNEISGNIQLKSLEITKNDINNKDWKNNFIFDKSFEYVITDKCYLSEFTHNYNDDFKRENMNKKNKEKNNSIFFMRCPLIKNDEIFGFYDIFKYHNNEQNVENLVENFNELNERIKRILE